MQPYDVIMLGLGGMGSAALFHLARRGQKVMGIERFNVPHDMGSSHGITRIIRLAYHEHPSYVPLLRRSYELWRELETIASERLLVVTGSIDASPKGNQVFEGAKSSSELHGLSHEILNSAELRRRFPGYELPAEMMAVFQPDGGFLLPERCIVSHVSAALSHGADVRCQEQVESWTPLADGVEVRTDRGVYRAKKLVIAAGAWSAKLVPELASLAVPERQVLAWFQPHRPEMFHPAKFPVFNMAVEEGHFYGFPSYGIPGFKIGKFHHFHETVDPDNMDRNPNRNDENVLRQATERYFPQAAGTVVAMKSCLFTNSPDEHFIIDLLPRDSRVAVAAGFSGHGFKFCSVVGEILADLSMTGATPHDLGLFKFGRAFKSHRRDDYAHEKP